MESVFHLKTVFYHFPLLPYCNCRWSEEWATFVW